MEKRSLGLIETWGFVPAIEAADAGTKAANVRLLGYEVVPVGRVMVAFAGDVAAVKAAVRSGSAAAERVGQVLAVHVIPRPDGQLRVEPPSKPLLPPDGAHGPKPGPESLLQEDDQEVEPGSPPAAPVDEAEPAPESPKDKAAKKSSKSAAKRNKPSGKIESGTERQEQADDPSSDT
jgi:hypothetical protein